MALKTSPGSGAPAGARKTLFGHPVGLANLFGVEMWERFSFYGMQSILAYYLYWQVSRGGLGVDQHLATAVVGAYGGTVFLAAIAGAWVSDRLLGAERTLGWSAGLVMVGQGVLWGIHGFVGLTLGLVLIALGSGGVKTTASTVLGELYDRNDPKKDAAFSLFYLGVNLGALFGPLVIIWALGDHNFHRAFALPAIGMALGLGQYLMLRKKTLAGAGEHPTNPLPKKDLPKVLGAIVVGALVVAAVFVFVLPAQYIALTITIISGIAAVVLWLQMYNSPLVSQVEKRRLLGFIPMFLGTVAFFTVFQQQFTVLAVYADMRLNRHLLFFDLKPSQVQLFNPVFIILLSGVFAYMWTKLGSRQPSTPVKYTMALVFIALGLFLFVPFANGQQNTTPIFAIIGILFLFTLGELMLSPVGLSMATKLAPEAFASRMMSLHFLASALGTALSGAVAAFYHPESASAEAAYFTSTAIAALVFAVIMYLIRKPVLRLFEGIR